MLGLPTWPDDPVARRYLTAHPTQRKRLKHKTFIEAMLFEGERGGAIILLTVDRRVLAMDYCDADDLTHHWRATLQHYAGVV